MSNVTLLTRYITFPDSYEDIVVDFLSLNGFNRLQIEDLEGGVTRVTIYQPERFSGDLKEALTALRAVSPDFSYQLDHGEIDDVPWYEHWKHSFKPIEAGKGFIVGPPWEELSRPGRRAIVINPADAFGTGYHETTRITISLMEQVSEGSEGLASSSVLDVGCGTGILSFAARVVGARDILAFDNDPDAVSNFHENLALNALFNTESSKITVFTGDISHVDRQFDLVLANILFVWRIAADLYRCTSPGGCCVITGFLVNEALEVREGFEAAGFNCDHEVVMGEWAGALLSRPAEAVSR